MRFFSIVLTTTMLFVVPALSAFAQTRTAVPDLDKLVDEALRNNPEIRASLDQVNAAHAGVARAGTLDDPELTYMREEMPGFRFSEAMYSRIELTQKFRFPTKLSGETGIAEIRAEHAHHDQYEKQLEVIARLKSAYYELWFVQQSITLNRENARLLQQFLTIAKNRFETGNAPLQDVMKANVELARMGNQGVSLHQQEQSTRALLAAILNRQPDDTIGVVILPDSVAFNHALDSLQYMALRSRPMLLHDSLTVEESRAMHSLSKREFLPDITIGLEYVTVPIGDFRGWSVRAGMTLPFAPWTLGRANAGVEQATAAISKSSSVLQASRTMVLSNVKDLYSKAQSAAIQFDSYRKVILPQARQSLKASMTEYQNGGSGFLMLIDAYRMLVELSMESLMVRLQYEQAVAGLEREVGIRKGLQ